MWMAPEVFMKKPYSFKADIYSYGVVIWEMSSIKEPYEGMSLWEVSTQVTEGIRNEMPKDAPKEWNLIYDKCTTKNPEDRISAQELVLFFTNLDKQGIF